MKHVRCIRYIHNEVVTRQIYAKALPSDPLDPISCTNVVNTTNPVELCLVQAKIMSACRETGVKLRPELSLKAADFSMLTAPYLLKQRYCGDTPSISTMLTWINKLDNSLFHFWNHCIIKIRYNIDQKGEGRTSSGNVRRRTLSRRWWWMRK